MNKNTYFNYAEKYLLENNDLDVLVKSYKHEQELGTCLIDIDSQSNLLINKFKNHINQNIHVTLQYNTTNTILKYLSSQNLNKGELLLTSIEFSPYFEILNNYEFDIINYNDTFFSNLHTLLESSNYKVLLVSHVSSEWGYLLNINKISQICKKYHVKLIVDATQAVGNISISNINFKDIDLYVFTLRKWINSVSDVAIVISKENNINSSRVYNYPSLTLALKKVEEYFNFTNNDYLKREELLNHLITRLETILSLTINNHNNGIAFLTFNYDIQKLYDFLIQHKIIVKKITNFQLRISISVHHNLEDINYLINTIEIFKNNNLSI